MKNKTGLVVTIIILVVVMFASFVAGGILIFSGGIQALKNLDLGGFESVISMFENSADAVEYTEKCDVTLIFSDTDIENIMIDSVPHDVKIVEGGSEIIVRYEGRWPESIDKNSFAKIEGNNLVISMEGGSGISVGWSFGCTVNANTAFGGELTITIPEGYECNIRVKDSVGNIDFDNISASEISFESVVGEIRGKNISASDISLDSVVGDIAVKGEFASFNAVDCVGEIDASTSAAIENNCRIADCMGNIELEIGKDSKVDVRFEGNFTAFHNEITETADGAVIEITDCMGQIDIDYCD